MARVAIYGKTRPNKQARRKETIVEEALAPQKLTPVQRQKRLARKASTRVMSKINTQRQQLRKETGYDFRIQPPTTRVQQGCDEPFDYRFGGGRTDR